MPTIAGVDFEEKEKTLILALNVNCGFCEKSLPFYEQLLTRVSTMRERRTLSSYSWTRRKMTPTIVLQSSKR